MAAESDSMLSKFKTRFNDAVEYVRNKEHYDFLEHAHDFGVFSKKKKESSDDWEATKKGEIPAELHENAQEMSQKTTEKIEALKEDQSVVPSN